MSEVDVAVGLAVRLVPFIETQRTAYGGARAHDQMATLNTELLCP